MNIRKSTEKDLPRMMEIFAHAREFMAAHGNPLQWGELCWPPEALVRQDIASGNSYVCEEEGRVVGTFFLDFGKDVEPTYARIYEGKWMDFNFGEGGEVGRHSSVGPTMSGLIKPEVVAPGVNIISSYSSYFLESNKEKGEWNLDYDIERFQFQGREYSWNAQSGTSMSSPLVGGIIALWLQAWPKLTPQQAIETIAQTSRHHDDSLIWPNNQYGYGEIDAEAGLDYILRNYAGIEDVQASKRGRMEARYDLSGRRVDGSALPKGIYIERYSNGSVRKISY